MTIIKVGISGTQYDEEKYYVREVAPPGFGHTKGDKEKGVKKGGTAAAFDKARKEGRFKGSKSDMFAIMWSQKKKGDKPHYKPGTDKKYKKYQDESVKDPTKKKPKAPQFNAAKELVTDAPYMKPALQQREGVSYKDFTKTAQAAMDRIKKAKEEKLKKNAESARKDRVEKGVRFYDKKGKGYIKKGKKVYT